MVSRAVPPPSRNDIALWLARIVRSPHHDRDAPTLNRWLNSRLYSPELCYAIDAADAWGASQSHAVKFARRARVFLPRATHARSSSLLEHLRSSSRSVQLTAARDCFHVADCYDACSSLSVEQARLLAGALREIIAAAGSRPNVISALQRAIRHVASYDESEAHMKDVLRDGIRALNEFAGENALGSWSTFSESTAMLRLHRSLEMLLMRTDYCDLPALDLSLATATRRHVEARPHSAAAAASSPDSAWSHTVSAMVVRACGLLGIDAPLTNYTLPDCGICVDLAWPAHRVVVELDGPAHFFNAPLAEQVRIMRASNGAHASLHSDALRRMSPFWSSTSPELFADVKRVVAAAGLPYVHAGPYHPSDPAFLQQQQRTGNGLSLLPTRSTRLRNDVLRHCGWKLCVFRFDEWGENAGVGSLSPVPPLVEARLLALLCRA